MTRRNNKEQNRTEKLKKILELEKDSGFDNSSVLGGLQSLSEKFIENNQVLELLEDYETKEPYERQVIVEEIENIVESDTEDSSLHAKDSQNLNRSVEKAIGVGKKRAKNLAEIGINTVRDLLFHFPRKIEDRRSEKKISQLQNGDKCTITGKVRGTVKIQPKKKLQLVKAKIEDETGEVYCIWFNQPWVRNQLNEGMEIALFGEVKKEYGKLQIENPIWEPANKKEKTRKLVPIYPATTDLSQRNMRWIIHQNVNKFLPWLSEFYPDEVANKYDLWNRKKALKNIHFPETLSNFIKARQSLSFSELYLFYYGLSVRTREKQGQSISIKVNKGRLNTFRQKIPFSLTSDQQRTLDEIMNDLQSPKPMNRLLQGDVGTGKTIVAAATAFIVSESKNQTALMVPTTVLAEQHFKNLSKIFRQLPLKPQILTGNTSSAQREGILKQLESGEIDILVGTHALLEEDINFENLGLLIIDEEQRFGVAQKEKLRKDYSPVNRLVLSATPIPRTITSTVFGEFEVSRLEEFPGGEKNIQTYWVSEGKRDQIYEYVRQKLKDSYQGFIVFPLIEESEKIDSHSAVEMQKSLSEKQLNGLKLGLLHGKMSEDRKAETIEKFRAGNLHAIVSTTVIEVGIDIPQANILVVEEADRFGLTQLHQLRGRIGRSSQKSYCFAIASPQTEKGRERLKAFRDILDGFELVEKDLEIRGPGDLLSSAQHGFQNSFYACDFLKDYDIMKKARKEVETALENQEKETEFNHLIEEYFGASFWKSI